MRLSLAVKKLQAFAAANGCELKHVPPGEWALGRRDFSACPFDTNLGVHYEKKLIVFRGDKAPNISHLIHEMAHVMASKKPPVHSDEWEFLGWEWILAHHVGAAKEWRRGNSDYATNDPDTGKCCTDFGKLTKKKQDNLLAERGSHAVKIGLVDGRTGIPRCIR